jgi:hypothetical protein
MREKDSPLRAGTFYCALLLLLSSACGGGLTAEDSVLVKNLQNQNKVFLLESTDAGAAGPGKIIVPTALLKANYCGAGRLLENHGESPEDAGIACPKGAKP